MDNSNVCHQRPQVLYHQFIGELYTDWQANMWSIQSFLLTQVSKHTLTDVEGQHVNNDAM